MMFDYMRWNEASQLINKGLEGAIQSKVVTYDFHRLMDNSTKVSCSDFGETIISNM